MEKPKLTTQEQLVKDAWEFVRVCAKAKKMEYKEFALLKDEDIKRFKDKPEIHIFGLPRLCELLNIEYAREDWDGNKVCKTNHDIIYFMYHGIKFFQLTDKETEDEKQIEGINDGD